MLHDFREEKGQHIQGINGNVTVQGVGTLFSDVIPVFCLR
jgi:hypothetical protein